MSKKSLAASSVKVAERAGALLVGSGFPDRLVKPGRLSGPRHRRWWP